MTRKSLIFRAIILATLGVSLFSCPRPSFYEGGGDPTAPFTFEAFTDYAVRSPEDFDLSKNHAREPEFYRPDTLHPDYLPMRNVRVNFHVMNTRDTLYDLHGEKAVKFFKDLMATGNGLMSERRKLWLTPDSMDVPALPTRTRFKFAKDPTTPSGLGIYEHYDDELYWYLHKGQGQNRGDLRVVKKYNVRGDEVLNVYFFGPPRDSLNSKTFRAPNTVGVYVYDAVKIAGLSNDMKAAWEYAGNLVHEFGHALGLPHAWGNDGCDDTPRHANNAWGVRDRGPGKTSNNLMDYSPHQRALSPCQIGRMHAYMSRYGSKVRSRLRPDWCTYRPDDPVRVQTDLALNGARDYASDLYVERGASLSINSRVHLPEGAGIYVEPGASLSIGPEAVLHSDCGGSWTGIHQGVTEAGYAPSISVNSNAVFLNLVGK